MNLVTSSTLPSLLAGSFQLHSGRIAVEYGEEKYSYAELEQLSWRYYHFYRDCGLQRGDHIGILSDVTPSAIGAMLGALYAGIIYIPVNIYAPAAWVSNLFHTAELKSIVVQRRYQASVTDIIHSGTQPVCFFDEIEKTTMPAPPAGQYHKILSDDIAWILYTSGSTGTPKGIMLTHRNACSFVVWMSKEFNIGQHDRIFSRAPLQFDLSVFDIFTTLLSGASLVIVPENFASTPDNIVSYMRDKGITVVYTVPSAYIRWLNKGRLERNIPSLRVLLYAGEPFAASWLRKVMHCLPQTRVANIYGPTETNIVTCHHLSAAPADGATIPIGYPVDETEIYIVDENLNSLPPGQMGEIVVRGSTVFAGYFNAPQLTAERLIQSPFHHYPTLVCRTGDYGSWGDNGELLYYGRMDNMVKTRGYRVEPGEVENALATIEGIEEAAIIPIADDKYGASLHACLTLSIPESELLQVQQRLKQILPDYMYPWSFTLMAGLPRTATGKIDRVKLKNQLINQLSKQKDLSL
ncbi:amino acid adenylation domain-containing protein [Erwinia toletana]|uniref:Amino acid adenylation domain-containing protein n=1 Tax=Winslowiella toletana TaxID=92490 RepID=A0ABS4PB85_9GAMM|nr:amino acid adenylation domain-containing protein [Winslowiella toletana]MBP2169417.1 amino acid adenylation domain-containing protein [Winslowiella toletana]